MQEFLVNRLDCTRRLTTSRAARTKLLRESIIFNCEKAKRNCKRFENLWRTWLIYMQRKWCSQLGSLGPFRGGG